MAIYRLCIRPDAKGKGVEVIIQRRHWLPFLWQDWGSVEDAERQLKREAMATVARLKQLAEQIPLAEKDKARAIEDAVQNGTKRGVGKEYMGKDTPRCYPEPPISDDDWRPIKAVLDSLRGEVKRGSKTEHTTAYLLPDHFDKYHRKYVGTPQYDDVIKFRPPPPPHKEKDKGKQQQQQQQKDKE